MLVFNLIALPRFGVELSPWREGRLQLPWFESMASFWIALLCWSMFLGFWLLTLSYLQLSNGESVLVYSAELDLPAHEVLNQLRAFAQNNDYHELAVRNPGESLLLAQFLMISAQYPGQVERAGNIGYLFPIRLQETDIGKTLIEVNCQRWRSHSLLGWLFTYADQHLYPRLEKRPQVSQFRDKVSTELAAIIST